ncbi:MAG: flagellar type III secretion system pore protein FliP [Planctomycetaceae bacterium]
MVERLKLQPIRLIGNHHAAAQLSRCTSILLSVLLLAAVYALMPATLPAQTTPRTVTPNQGIESAPLVPAGDARAQGSEPSGNEQSLLPTGLDVDRMLSPGGLSSTLKIMLLMTVISLAPSILIMTTCFIRFVIVLGLLRQALGTQQLPPNQVIVSLCLFLTFLVMAPVWQQSYEQGIRPYTNPQSSTASIGFDQAFQQTVAPLRRFMSQQIEAADNSDAVWMFLEFQRPDPQSPEGQTYQLPENYDDCPLSVLLPAFMLSELKTAFIIGFQVYLPFLVIDMVVSSILISMGMMMLPPVLISLPFKLLLFVMIDGWYLTVGMLLESVRPFG